MDDEDEVDILGDFTLENLLTKNDNRIWSCYEGDNEYPASHWLQESTSQCWQDDRSLCGYSSSSNLLMPSSSSSVIGSLDKDTSWTDKECYLLDKGLELFGRSWSRLAQYIGSKTSQQVRARVKSCPMTSSVGGAMMTSLMSGAMTSSIGGGMTSSLGGVVTSSVGGDVSSPDHWAATCSVLDSSQCSQLIDDMQIPASIEEVIATVTTAKPTVQNSTPRQRLNSGSNSASLGSVHSCHSTGSAPSIKKSRGRPRKDVVSERRDQKLLKRKEERRRRGAFGKKRVSTTELTTSEELLLNLPYVLPNEQHSITLPSGEQVIRIQRDNSQEDDEIDIEDGSDVEVNQNDVIVKDNQHEVKIDQEDNVKIEATIVDFQPESGSAAIEEVPKVHQVPAKCKPQSALQSHQAAVMSKYMQTIQERLENVHRLPEPTREIELNFDIVSEEEMKMHPEFFAKTENFNRYLRIRSHIVNAWLEAKPNYITKTSVRLGLKNCGDVNLISRVHAYLEQKGYINFGCEQCHYRTASSGTNSRKQSEGLELSNPKSDPTDSKSDQIGTESEPIETKSNPIESVESESVESKVRISSRKRMPCFKLRVADEENSGKPLLTKRVSKEDKIKSQHQIDLITCREFTDSNPAPYCCVLKASALIVANFHASSNKQTEVIGLLGGIYDLANKSLEIHLAVPCRSLNADQVNCEICPVSQSEASAAIERCGLEVVGWYHSHPGFKPNPSRVDLRTQADYQRWFNSHQQPDQQLQLQQRPFVSLIVSPDLLQAAESSISDCSSILYRMFFVIESSSGELIPYRLRPQIDSSNFTIESVIDSIQAIKDVS